MTTSQPAIEAVYRQKYGELLAGLLRALGYEHFDRVEDALQVAFARALEKWKGGDAPDNPAGWLYVVARNACLESLRRDRLLADKARQLGYETPEWTPPAEVGTGEAMSQLDDFAAMVLLCCNPDLTERSQLCLMLRAGCGLSVHEIGRLLGMADEAVKKTLTRAKDKIARDGTPFDAVDAHRTAARFPLVVEAVYGVFTEGYAAASGETTLRREIAAQALHMCESLQASRFTPPDALGTLHALRALMLLQFARFDARMDPDGVPVRLQEQDRSRWHQSLIRAGLDALRSATVSPSPSPYHLEARIAAEHATSRSFEETDWNAIVGWYDELLHLKETPAVRLSRIVALRHAVGPGAALAELDALATGASGTAGMPFLRHAVRADILEALGRPDAARESWDAALASAPTAGDEAFVRRRALAAAADVPPTGPRTSI